MKGFSEASSGDAWPGISARGAELSRSPLSGAASIKLASMDKNDSMDFVALADSLRPTTALLEMTLWRT